MMTRQSILNLLRSGALEQAEKAYLEAGLDRDKSSEDAMALGGRILKAKALEHQGDTRRALAHRAARKYAQAYAVTGGTYSGINTAALYLVAGDVDSAQKTARAVAATLRQHRPKPGLDAYYHLATLAEVALVLGQEKDGQALFADAVALAPHEHDAHASTLRQFEMLYEAKGEPAGWLDMLRPPPALHFAGHIWHSDSLDQATLYGLEKSIDDVLECLQPGAAFGALAAGADILIAERLIGRGVPLHVVQPCPDILFMEQSLTPFGEWGGRFEACLKAAASVRHISPDETLCDSLTTAFASETAMGLVVLHAHRLATRAEQLLVWDKIPSVRPAGTARDAAFWAKTGRSQKIVSFSHPKTPPVGDVGPGMDGAARCLKAMLFADVAGFGRLSERQLPLFVSQILTSLAVCCKEAGLNPSHVNTWGDGLFLVFDSVRDAALAATVLRDTFLAKIAIVSGLPHDMALRIGGHCAPVHSLGDPFLMRQGIFGREVTTAARIEPVTPPGSIYVSEAFACALAARGERGFHCEPMPETVPCRDRGALTLFSLRRNGAMPPEVPQDGAV